MAKKLVTDLDVTGKKVIVRVDFNVPLKNGELMIIVLLLHYQLLNI